MAKILIVDDRPDNREFLAMLLAHHDHSLLEAADGAEGLALARAEHPDLVITDVLMPTMNGYEFVRQLRADATVADTPVILCTANYHGREARKMANSAGVAHLIVSPSEPEPVLRAVDQALGLKSAAPAAQVGSANGRVQGQPTPDKILELERELAACKNAEQQLGEINEELVRRVAARSADLAAAKQELDALNYLISHDLRAPLRATTGFLGFLAQDFGAQMPGEAQYLLTQAAVNARRMEQLIADLLRLSQLSRQTMSKDPVDMATLVHEALHELREERSGRHVEVSEGRLADAVGDREMLKQVFVNLLSNALKFTRHKERAVVEIGCRPDQSENTYFVRDNGAGFDMRYAAKLFGVFQRLHSAAEFEGAGVGLALVQRLVHRHGGRVWAEAQVDAGATFYFTLPE